MKADYICFVDEQINPEEDLLLFDPSETWKKTKMKAGTYTVREMMQPIFINGECVYTSPSVKEIAAYCRQEKIPCGMNPNDSSILTRCISICLQDFMK